MGVSGEMSSPVESHARATPPSSLPPTPSSIEQARRVAHEVLDPAMDEFLCETFQTRLAALMDLRIRIEDLADLHRKEEKSFVETMRGLVHQTTEEQRQTRDKVKQLEGQLGQYENLLHTEEREKSKAMEMVATFRKEGEQILTRLRESLNTETRKYQQEKERADMLQRQLEDRERHWESVVKQQEKRIVEFRGLLDEEEKLVAQLQQRNEQLEVQLKNAERLASDLSGEGAFSQDYQDIMNELKGVDRSLNSPPVATPTATATPSSEHESLQHKIRLQDQVIKKLWAKLKSEQKHRLMTEEQAAQMVANEEDTIRKLEERVKDLERCPTPKYPTSSTTTATSAPTPVVARGLDSPRSPATQPVPRLPPHGPSLNTLEQQLAEVTRDFNTSLDMWNKRLQKPQETKPLLTQLPASSKIAPVRPSHTAPAAKPPPLPDEFSEFLPNTPTPNDPLLDADFLPESPPPATDGGISLTDL